MGNSFTCVFFYVYLGERFHRFSRQRLGSFTSHKPFVYTNFLVLDFVCKLVNYGGNFSLCTNLWIVPLHVLTIRKGECQE